MEGVFPTHFSATYLMFAGQPLTLDNPLTLFIRDAFRFISAFITPISQSVPHVYLSALPFAPEESHVARKFRSRFPNTFVVTQGKPIQWSMAVFTAEHQKNSVEKIAFSPDESTCLYISESGFYFMGTLEGATYICDSETGRCILGPFHGAHDVCFSPVGKHILLRYGSCAVVWDIETGEEQFQIEGSDFAFVRHDERIASMKEDGNWDNSGDGNPDNSEDGNPDDFEDKDANRILVQFWDAGNGELISSRLMEVNDVFDAQFSPDGHFMAIRKRSEDVLELWNLEDSKDFRQFTCPRGHLHRRLSFLCFSPDGRFLAIQKKSEDVIELWNLEDSKDFRQFTYPHGGFESLRFSPTSDTLMVETNSDFTHRTIYLWRLDTQEMVSFSCDRSSSWSSPHVIHSPLTNYLFLQRDWRVEIWDVSATGSKMIWKHASLSGVISICPSSNGHRVLVGYRDGSMRMWNLDLENLAMSQADTTDTRDDSDRRRVIRMSPSGKMVITRPQRSSKVKFLDTTTKEVIACTDIECKDCDMEIAFSPDEEQVAFWSESLITICDIMHPEKCVSFDPWPGKVVRERSVAFQTCNDLVICTVSWAGSGLLQVWHWQDPTGFECTYSLDFEESFPLLAPDGLTVIIVPWPWPSPFNHETAQVIVHFSSYSWNYRAAQFHPVRFDNQVHISRHPPPQYSSDGELFACLSEEDSYVRVWDTLTGHLVSMFRTSEVDGIALSPALTHSLGKRLIALSFRRERVIRLFDGYTGHLHAQILGETYATTAFIRDGTALANYYDCYHNSGVRIWEIADLTVEHQHSTHGYELMLQGTRDGWMMGQDNEPLFWVPVENRKHLYMPSPRAVIEGSDISTVLDYSNSRFGRNWTECIDKEWLKELEQKEKEVGKRLE